MMHRYKIQHWGWKQEWFDGPCIWEMDPSLFSDWLAYINPNGGPTHDILRVLRTDEEPMARFLGGRVVMDLRPFSEVEAIQRENEAFGEFLETIEHLEPKAFMQAVDEWIAS